MGADFCPSFMLGIFVTPGVSVLRKAGLKVKHTIVEEWPFRLKLEPGEPGAQEEFDRLLAGGSSGKECYVEWKRLLSDKDMEAGADDDGGYTGEPTSSQLMTPTLAHLLEQYLTM